MLPHPLQLECTERLPEDSGELEMYSVKFVLSVASRRTPGKIERQRNRSSRYGAQDSDYPSPAVPPTSDMLRGWQLD